MIILIPPCIAVQSNSKLELIIAGNSRCDVVTFNNLVAVEPKLEIAIVVGAPLGLDDDLVPLAAFNLGNVVETDKVSVTVVAAILTL